MTPQKQSTQQDYHERIIRTLVFLQEHLDEELSLERVAGVAAFSHFHFHRIFRALVGETPSEHVRRLRLERAAQHLKRSETPVTDLAFASGYDSHEAFTRAFRAMFGVPPTEYRASHRPAPECASGTHYGDTMTYHAPDYEAPPVVEVLEVPPTRIVFLRHVGPYNQVGQTWGRLNEVGRNARPTRARPAHARHRPRRPRRDTARQDPLRRRHRPEPAARAAGRIRGVVTHRGPYDGLGQTYQRLYGAWLPRTGHQVRDVPAFGEYRNSPQNIKPEDLLTKVRVPIV